MEKVRRLSKIARRKSDENSQSETWLKRDREQRLAPLHKDMTIEMLAQGDDSKLCRGILAHPVQGCWTCSWGHTHLVCTSDREVTGYDMASDNRSERAIPKRNRRAEEGSDLAIQV